MRLVRARDDKEPKVLPGLMALQKAEGEGGGRGERIFRVFKERDRIRGTAILLVRARDDEPEVLSGRGRRTRGKKGRRDGGTEGGYLRDGGAKDLGLATEGTGLTCT